jgi:hypothetical protein
MKESSDSAVGREPAQENPVEEKDIRETIAVLAYKFSEERRGEGGSPLDDWLKAERLVRKHFAHHA